MFEMQTGNGKSYKNDIVTSNADTAIYRFINAVDHFPATRILRNGVIMARHTAKGSFIHPDWR